MCISSKIKAYVNWNENEELLLLFYSYAKELVFTMFGTRAPDFGAASDGMSTLHCYVVPRF